MIKLYLEVTKDEYALPVKVADSPRELAKMCGISIDTVNTLICKANKGEIKRPRFIRIDIEED